MQTYFTSLRYYLFGQSTTKIMEEEVMLPSSKEVSMLLERFGSVY